MAASIVDDLLGRQTPTSSAATSWHASSVGVPGASLGLPRAVGAHYLKCVLDWLVSQLVRQQAPKQGAAKQKGAKQDGATGGHAAPGAAAQPQGPQSHALTHPRAWRLLADLLSGDWGGAAASAAVPASILIAAAAAARHAAGEGGRASGGAGGSDDEPRQLLAAVDAVLRALMMPGDVGGRGGGSGWAQQQRGSSRGGGSSSAAAAPSAAARASAFRASLEQLVALVAGVLDAQPRGECEPAGAESAWAGLAATCVWCLERSASSSANPKKVRIGTCPFSILKPYAAELRSIERKPKGEQVDRQTPLFSSCVLNPTYEGGHQPSPSAPCTTLEPLCTQVFTSVVGRLMAPLAPLAFPTPDDGGSSVGSDDDVRSQLAAAARALLEVSLLHEVHVVGIAEAAGAKLEAADAKLQEAAPSGGGDAGAGGDAQGGKKAKRQKAAKGAGRQEQEQEEGAAAGGADGGDGGQASGARTYHGLLLQVSGVGTSRGRTDT
jgi:hypothetical protein